MSKSRKLDATTDILSSHILDNALMSEAVQWLYVASALKVDAKSLYRAHQATSESVLLHYLKEGFPPDFSLSAKESYQHKIDRFWNGIDEKLARAR